jgi:Tfp pilus assembly PilM family ATPase
MVLSIIEDAAEAVEGADLGAVTVAVLAEHLTGINSIPQDTTHQLIGVNSLLKNAIKSAKTVTRKVNLAVPPSALLVTFLLSTSPPLLEPFRSTMLK